MCAKSRGSVSLLMILLGLHLFPGVPLESLLRDLNIVNVKDACKEKCDRTMTMSDVNDWYMICCRAIRILSTWSSILRSQRPFIWCLRRSQEASFWTGSPPGNTSPRRRLSSSSGTLPPPSSFSTQRESHTGDWSRHITWPELWPLIGWKFYHVCSDWSSSY